MVGANTLLGETLRMNLAELARRGQGWCLAPVPGAYPSADPLDPLAEHDDPAADAQAGILSRDGGHFEALFSSGADEFADAAAARLRRELPGLRFRISIDRTERESTSVDLSTELPVLTPCDWTGRGLASVSVRQGTERAAVSLDVSRQHEAARRAEEGDAKDLVTLLSRQVPVVRPPTFADLVGNGYLAVVHADGNGVGGAAGSTDPERATFFHRNRVLLRRALKSALDQASEGDKPVVPLMLGGDDLLVVCRADAALAFVIDLCDALERLQVERAERFHLTLGVGVVFSRPTVPFHRLHEVAENLASSAKQKFRGLKEADRGSVVDWAVYTTAWVDEPAEVRRRDWVRSSGGDARVLSRRPMAVLGDGLGGLQGLVIAGGLIGDAPRSQLRYLVDQLPRGKALADLAFAELSKDAKDKLKKAGVEAVWGRSTDTGPYLTSVLDLVEVAEIHRLGRAGTIDAAGGAFEEIDERGADHVHGF